MKIGRNFGTTTPEKIKRAKEKINQWLKDDFDEDGVRRYLIYKSNKKN